MLLQQLLLQQLLLLLLLLAARIHRPPRISSALPQPRVTNTPQQLCYLIFEFSLFLSCSKCHVTLILLH